MEARAYYINIGGFIEDATQAAKIEVATAASSKDDGEESPAAQPSHVGPVATCVVVSLAFACLAARALCRAGAVDEDNISVALWELSPLICAYLFLWTIALSGARDAATVTATVFSRATFLLLAGAAAARLVSPGVGTATTFLATLYAAAPLGRSLAVRRQRTGAEKTAAAAAASAPTYRSRAEVDHERSCRTFLAVSMVFMAGASCAIVSLAKWLGPEPQETPAGGGDAALFLLMFFAGPFLLVSLQLVLLHGSPLQAETETFVASMLLGVIGSIAVAVVAGVLYGEVGAVVVVWAAALGMAGMFGYGRAVQAHYERLMATKRSEPRMAQDDSGLLDGRDEEDACSAYIDAATGVCVDCVLPRRNRCTCRS